MDKIVSSDKEDRKKQLCKCPELKQAGSVKYVKVIW